MRPRASFSETAPFEQSGEEFDARATLAMVDVQSRVRVKIGIFTRQGSARDLVKQIVGIANPQADDANDFLVETCNHCLGAVKSTLRLAGHQFTRFVPRARFVPLMEEWREQFEGSRTVYLTGGPDVNLVIVVGVRATGVRAVDVAELHENMVLAESLSDGRGAVVLEAATRLTATLLVTIKAQAAGSKALIVD